MARTHPHVKSCANFYRYQSACRRGHSTETTLLGVLDDAYHAADNHSRSLLLQLDLSAAFDTLDKPTLLRRLNHTFGVRSTSHKWSTPTSTNAVSTSESVIAYHHQSAATMEFLKAVCSVPCCSLTTPRQLSASSHPSETFNMLSTPMTLNYTSLSPLTRHSALSMTVSSPSIVGWTPTGFV